MTLTRTEINRRAAAVRRIVLRRLAEQQPDTYRLWMREAYKTLDAELISKPQPCDRPAAPQQKEIA